jgi:hypothetical protein
MEIIRLHEAIFINTIPDTIKQYACIPDHKDNPRDVCMLELDRYP